MANMFDPKDNDVLLKLVIQGQSAAEIQRLAEDTQGRLNSEMKSRLSELTAAHKKADDDIAKGHQDAAKKTSEAWKQAGGDMANVGVLMAGSFAAVAAGVATFHRLGEEVIKTAQIYGSLKGSIVALREATGGEVADIDLITAKNRAMEKDLQLTDQQFAAVAKQAKHFGDVLGTDTSEALNQLIDGLATGRVKMLAHAGVVIDAEAAYKKFAEAQGLVVEHMTTQEKLLAVQTEALEKMKKKTEEVGETGMTVANALEVAFAKVKNAITGTLAAIGNAKLNGPDQSDFGLGDLDNARQESIAHGDPSIYQRALAARDRARAARAAASKAAALRPFSDEEIQAQQDQFFGGGMGLYGRLEDKRTGADLQEEYKKRQEAARKAAAAAEAAQKDLDELAKFNAKWNAILRGDKQEGIPGLQVPTFTDEQRSHDLDMAFDVTGGNRAAPRGLSGSLARQAALQKAFGAKGERDAEDEERQQQQAAEAMAKVNEDAMTEMLDRTEKLRERAGNGIFATLLFGPDGREQLLDDIDAFKNNAADAAGMVADAAHKMAEALGASLAAFVSGDKNKRKSIQDTTHDILQALATQAYARAIFETAEGFASLALGPIGGVSASQHFLAAGMFTAAGTAAGLGARAVGQNSAVGGGAGAGAGASNSRYGGTPPTGYSGTSTSGGSFGSGGVRSSGGGGYDNRPVTIQINSPLGDRAEIGRSVAIALSEYYSRTGRGIPLAQGSV